MDIKKIINKYCMSTHYIYTRRNDPDNEVLGTVLINSRLLAAKWFAERKQLKLKEFLKLFKVSK